MGNKSSKRTYKRRFYHCETYNTLAVNNSLDKNGTGNLIEKRLSKTYLTIASALEYCYSSVLQQHFTITLPDDFPAEIDIKDLYKRFKDKLDRDWRLNNNKRRKLFYIATIEKEKSKKCHIHFMTFTDSNVNTAIGVINLIEEAWKHAINHQFIVNDDLLDLELYKKGLVHYKTNEEYGIEKYQHLINKHNFESISQAMFWASYLCKNRKGTDLDKFKSSSVSKTAGQFMSDMLNKWQTASKPSALKK
ncbi:YagK/YfjJ domain-containing protein [Pseudoalteromonas sp. SYSU M81236]|uniref:YagK/YfjJ domain-containing protein n=1 Tax=Pseudoalteromonas sp. SYSU M81236 TaxID=3447014 RepID=UPI003F04AEA3